MLRSNVENILESLNEGILALNKELRIIYANRAAENILQYFRTEMTGKYCKTILQSNLCNTQCPVREMITLGNRIEGKLVTIKSRTGQSLQIQLNATFLKKDNQIEGVVISFSPIDCLNMKELRFRSEDGFYGIIGKSRVMQEIYNLIEEIADSDASVLIQGESGTGKEIIADAIQKTSNRKDKPYIKINCAVYPEQLLASELFGHVKGAYTGAIKDRKGRFQLAHEGTIFLDEIGEMSPAMQVQLLRVLQEGTFERLGESITRKVDVRIIAATNRNLEQAIARGEFREDLYFRLNVVPILVPPLRDRKEDIPILVNHFLKNFSLLYKKNIYEIDDQVMDFLMAYDWPGNVRELENTIEYMFIRSRPGQILTVDKLPPKIKLSQKNNLFPQLEKLNTNVPKDDLSIFQSVQSEEQLIKMYMEKFQWNRTKVAKALNMGRTTLWRKMKKYGLL